MAGKVVISGVNTSQLPLIGKEEMRQLFIQMKNGDQQARQKLIQGNLRLVLSVIKRFENRNENVDDLFQIGCIGLIKGIDNFDINLQVLPSTYLVPMVIGEIRRYLRDSSTLRVSRSLRDVAYRALQVKERFINEHQREPSIVELSEELGMPKEEVVFALDAIVEPISLFEPVFSEGGDTICVMDQVGDQKNTDENWLNRIALREAMKKLGPREQKILQLRFFAGRTQMEVAEEIGISQAQVSRLEKSALARVRKQI